MQSTLPCNPDVIIQVGPCDMALGQLPGIVSQWIESRPAFDPALPLAILSSASDNRKLYACHNGRWVAISDDAPDNVDALLKAMVTAWACI